MPRQYRIRHPLAWRDLGPGAGLVLACALTAGATWFVSGPSALVVAGLAVAAGGVTVLLRRHLRAGTVLLLAPEEVAVGPWVLPWSSVSRLVVFDTGSGQPAVLGAQLRSVDHLPAGVPTTQLDQTTPAMPIILSIVDAARLDVAGLTAACRRIRPDVPFVHNPSLASH